MLETVDLDAELSKEEYKRTQEALDLRLAELQRGLRPAGVPVLVVFEGWDAAGKGTVMARLLQAFDPRGFKVHTIEQPTEEERFWPPMWRFWRTLPENGTISLYDRSWYRQLLDERVDGSLSPEQLRGASERIRVFERQLTESGAIIVKFFLHISKKEQSKRFKKLLADPAFAWRIGKEEQEQHKRYDEFALAVEDLLRETSTPNAPWTLVPATDERFARVKVAETIIAALSNPLSQAPELGGAVEPAPRRTSPLDRLDMNVVASEEEYTEAMPRLQEELRRLQHFCYKQRRPVVFVYEGWDAGGKGGNIRRLVRQLDPRGYDVIPIAAPQGDERTHHYLWRFWRAVPKAGHFAIFDRSWYGRVMVERIENFATYTEWARAYREINEFEADLVDYGAVVIKFWIHISKDEQLRRFEDRQNIPEKRWKITDEDWRNREKWEAYWVAVSDMIERTSTVHAPWTIIEGNDKRYARMKTLRVATERIAAALGEKCRNGNSRHDH